VLLRVFVFFFLSTALTALMPLVARRLGGGAGSFTLLMSCMGLGAMVAVMVIPSLRDRYSRDLIVRVGSLVVSAMTLLVALSPWLWLSAVGMALGGMAWISCANTLTMSAQLALPNWVRARGHVHVPDGAEWAARPRARWCGGRWRTWSARCRTA